MNEISFIDTNVLVYTDDAANVQKQVVANELLRDGWTSGNAVISTQVLQEYFVAATRKVGVSVETARRKVELFDALVVVGIDHANVIAAIDLQRLHQWSFWDALIVAAAQKSACRVLYTEDLQHGMRVGGVRIVNPFDRIE